MPPRFALPTDAGSPADATPGRAAPTTIRQRCDGPSEPAGPLDRAGIEQLKIDLGGAEILGELVGLFGSQTPQRLLELRRAMEAGDSAAVSSLAHQLKGGCLTLAANPMAALCGELQDASRGGSLTRAGALIQELEVGFEQAYAALRREVS